LQVLFKKSSIIVKKGGEPAHMPKYIIRTYKVPVPAELYTMCNELNGEVEFENFEPKELFGITLQDVMTEDII